MAAADTTVTASRDYYDVIMIGKTGQGKSTLGNKLLNVPPKTTTMTTSEPSTGRAAIESALEVARKIGSMVLRFITADDVEESRRKFSITENCEVSINENIKLRVMDTPGFASSEMTRGVTVFESNLQIFRWIVREQLNPNVKMGAHRLLYFLPNRGPLRKADGSLQEELKVMYHFFGRSVFDNMVIVATQDLMYQDYPFTNEHLSQICDVFCKAVFRVTDIEMTPATCPPVIYIGYDHTHDDVLQAVKHAKVLAGDGVFKPAFRDDVCSRCAATTRYSKTEDKLVPVGVINGDIYEKYEESKCHPKFIPKYSKTAKTIGGIVHVLTLGTFILHEIMTGDDTFPGFTNSDEICPFCEQAPGSKGCIHVLKKYKLLKTNEIFEVDHTNAL